MTTNSKKNYNKKDWQKLAEKETKGKPIDELAWQTPEGFSVKPLYTSEDTHNLKLWQGRRVNVTGRQWNQSQSIRLNVK